MTVTMEKPQGVNNYANIPWWRGNARLKDLSGRLLGAHAVLVAGGIYHPLIAPAILERDDTFSGFFGYDWQDTDKMTTIIGIHLILLGMGAFGLVFKAMFWGGLFDLVFHPSGEV